MAFDTSRVAIRIQAEGADQARREISGVEQQLGRLGSGLQKVAHYGAGLLVALPALQQLAGQAIQTADSVTMLRNRLALATGNAQAARKAYDDLYRIAQQSRVGFTELGGTFATISRAGQELGISQRRLLTVTEAIGNAMTISGGTAQSMQAALVQLSQGLASGTLRGEELNSVMEQTPRLAKALADGLGVPLGALRKLGEEGKITAEQVIAALESQSSKLASEVSGATMTVSQGMTVLKNAMTLFIGQADEASGATAGLASILVSLAKFIEWIAKETPALDVLRVVGQTIRLIWSDVVFVFEGVGREIGGIAAQFVAVLSGNFAGAVTIRRAMVEDAKAARAALDAYQRGVVAPAAAAGFEQNDAETDRLLRRSNDLRKAQVAAAEEAAKRLAAARKAAEEAANAEAKAWNDSVEEYLRYREQVTKAKEKAYDDMAGSVADLQKQIQSQQDANLASLEGADALKELEIARLRETASMAARKAFVLAEREGNTAMAELYLRQAEALRTLADERERAMGIEGANKEAAANRAAAERATADWKRASDDIERSITDALMRGFESGRGFVDSLVSSIRSAFKTLVLQPVVQAIVRPVAGGATSFLGLGPQQAGRESGIIGALDNLSSVFTNWRLFGGAGGGGIFGSAAAYGAAIGTTNIAAGSQAALLAEQTGAFGAAGLAGTTSAAAGGGAGLASMGSTISAAMPYVAAIIAGAQLSLKDQQQGFDAASARRAGDGFGGKYGAGTVFAETSGFLQRLGMNKQWADILSISTHHARFFGRGSPQGGAVGITGTIADGSVNAQAFQDWKAKGGFFRSDRTGTNFAGLDDRQTAALTGYAREAKDAVEAYADALGLPVESLSRVSRQFRIELGNDDEANRKAIEDMVAKYRDDLAASYEQLLQPFAKFGETATETLTRLASLQEFSKGIHELGTVFSRVANLSVDAREQMVALAGGMEAFSQNALGFVQNYYSRDEIAGLKAREIQGTLAGLGINQDFTGGDAMAQFRALVEGTDVNTEAGRRQLATLLGIQGDFAQLGQYLGETGGSLSGAAAQAPQVGQLQSIFQGASMQQVQATQQAAATIVTAVQAMHETLREVGDALGSAAAVGGWSTPRINEVVTVDP